MTTKIFSKCTFKSGWKFDWFELFYCDQRSISSTFYEQLLILQIQKAQKDTDDVTVFFALLGSEHVKALLETLVKSTPSIMYTCHFCWYFQLKPTNWAFFQNWSDAFFAQMVTLHLEVVIKAEGEWNWMKNFIRNSSNVIRMGKKSFAATAWSHHPSICPNVNIHLYLWFM